MVSQGQTAEALEIAKPGFEFLRCVDALNDEANLMCCVQLSLIFRDLNPQLSLHPSEVKQMLGFSQQVLREALHICRDRNMSLSMISIEDLSKVASVLGV